MSRPLIQSSISPHLSPPPGPPGGNTPLTYQFGFIWERRHESQHVLYHIRTDHNGSFAFRSPPSTANKLLTAATVRFTIPPIPEMVRFKDIILPLVEGVINWLEPFSSPSDAPSIPGTITTLGADNKGSIRVGNSNFSVFFIANKLGSDSHHPSVGSEVIFNTFTILDGAKAHNRVYRVRLDAAELAKNRVFVVPRYVVHKVLEDQFSTTDKSIYFGEFDEEALVESGSPVLNYSDFSQLLAPTTNLDSFTLQMALDAIVGKYTKQEQDILDAVKSQLPNLGSKDAKKAIDADPGLIRVRATNSFLRNIGASGHPPPSIIINPLTWMGAELRGAKGRFVWTDFAHWTNVFLTHGSLSHHFLQVILLRPHNLWSDVDDLTTNSPPYDYSRSISSSHFLRGTLLGSDPVNFGSWSVPDQEIQYKYAMGVHRIAFCCFATPTRFPASPFFELLGGKEVSSIEVSDGDALEEENGSAVEIRASPPPNPDSLVISHTNRNLTPAHHSIINSFKRMTQKFSTLCPVSPNGFSALIFTPAPRPIKPRSPAGSGPTGAFSSLCLPPTISGRRPLWLITRQSSPRSR